MGLHIFTHSLIFVLSICRHFRPAFPSSGPNVGGLDRASSSRIRLAPELVRNLGIGSVCTERS